MKKILLLLIVAVMAMTAMAGDNASRKSTIHLKSGEYVTGVITARDETKVDIETEDGMKYVYTTSEIDYITHEMKRKNYDTSKFRGFVEMGYSMGLGEPRCDYWLIETSFGYQCTTNLYLGAGIGVHKFDAKINTFPLRNDYAEPMPNDPDLNRMPFIPLYADARYNLRSENFNTPWASLKAGYSIFNHGGVFLSPSVGYHFASNQFFSFNVGLGYALHTAKYKLWCTGDTPGAIPDKGGHSYLDKTGVFHNVFVKVGVEF